MEERFGHELGNWLARRMGKALKGMDCISNFSIEELPSEGALIDNILGWRRLKRHSEIRSSGCCGSVDVELHHYRSGRRFAFGFNHGH